MIKMKALKSFGFPGANEGPVKRGREFDVRSEGRAKELEAEGLAARVVPQARMVPDDARNKMEPDDTRNKTGAPTTASTAVTDRPLLQAGGRTGPARPVPSSRPGPLPGSKR